jgi:hypothetical protein
MNWKRINDILRKRDIHPDQRPHIGCIRQHPKETDEHFFEKCRIARELYKEGKPYIVECWNLKRDKRYDILDLEDDLNIEITTDIKRENKKKYKGDIVHEV